VPCTITPRTEFIKIDTNITLRYLLNNPFVVEMENLVPLKKTLLESLLEFLLKDVIYIVFNYAVTYNSEELIKTIEIYSQCNSIAVNDKQIFVSNGMTDKVCVYDKKTDKLLYTFGRLGTCIEKEGLMWEDYNQRNRIAKTLNRVRFNYPCGLTINENILYVVDCNNHRIQMFNIYGSEQVSFSDCFGKYGRDDDKFAYPTDIKIFDDEIFVCDSRNSKIKIYNKKNYKFITSFWHKLCDHHLICCPISISVDEKHIIISAENCNFIPVFDKKTHHVIHKINKILYPRYSTIIDDEIFFINRFNKINVFNKSSFMCIREIQNDKIGLLLRGIALYDDEIYVLDGHVGFSVMHRFKRLYKN
jgi:DNA-binding beta-propeller fold protein YncE